MNDLDEFVQSRLEKHSRGCVDAWEGDWLETVSQPVYTNGDMTHEWRRFSDGTIMVFPLLGVNDN